MNHSQCQACDELSSMVTADVETYKQTTKIIQYKQLHLIWKLLIQKQIFTLCNASPPTHPYT